MWDYKLSDRWYSKDAQSNLANACCLESSVLASLPFGRALERGKMQVKEYFPFPSSCFYPSLPLWPLSFSIPSLSFYDSHPSSHRVPPSPQQFIIITSPQCDGAHLRLIMCHTTQTCAHSQTRNEIHLSLITCLTVLLTWEIIHGTVCWDRGQELHVGQTHTSGHIVQYWK